MRGARPLRNFLGLSYKEISGGEDESVAAEVEATTFGGPPKYGVPYGGEAFRGCIDEGGVGCIVYGTQVLRFGIDRGRLHRGVGAIGKTHGWGAFACPQGFGGWTVRCDV